MSPPPFSVVFDPNDRQDFTEVANCGFVVSVLPQAVADIAIQHQAWSSDKPEPRSPASHSGPSSHTNWKFEAFRTRGFTFMKSEHCCFQTRIADHTLVLDYSRVPFVKKTTNVAFVDGIPQDLAQKVPSPVVGFLAIPKGVLQALFRRCHKQWPDRAACKRQGDIDGGHTSLSSATIALAISAALTRRDFFKLALAETAVRMVAPLRKAYANEKARESLTRVGTTRPSSSTYTHRFSMGPLCGSKLEEGLRNLAGSMMAPPDEACVFESSGRGYTYFGQFIDHDLTLDFSPLEKP